MIINSTGIEKLLRNYLEIEQTEEGLVIHRFTKRQRSVYDSQENWKIRARCPSGVSLEMFTNARFIRLLFSILGRTRDWSFFDLFINDIFLDSQSSHSDHGVLHTVEFEFAKKQEKDLQRVTIYLPHNIYLALQSVEIIDGEALPVTGSIHKKLLCLGDSITQGMDAYYPSNTYPVQLARFFEMDLLNQGVGGYIFNAVEITGIIVSGFMYFSSDYYRNNALDFGSLAFDKNISDYDERILMKMEIYENSDYYNSLLSSKARDIYPEDTEKQDEYISTNTIPDSLSWQWINDDIESFYFMRKQSRALKQYFLYSVSAIAVNHLTSAIFTFFNVNKKIKENVPDVYGFYDGTNFVLKVGMNF